MPATGTLLTRISKLVEHGWTIFKDGKAGPERTKVGEDVRKGASTAQRGRSCCRGEILTQHLWTDDQLGAGRSFLPECLQRQPVQRRRRIRGEHKPGGVREQASR